MRYTSYMPEQSQKEHSIYDGHGLTGERMEQVSKNLASQAAAQRGTSASVSAILDSKLQNLASQRDMNTARVHSVGAILDAKIAAAELHLEKLRRARTVLDLTNGSEILLEHLVNADVVYIR